MLLRFTTLPGNWVRLAATLEATDSPILAGVVRSMLATAAGANVPGPVPLAFTPQPGGEVQRVAATIGLTLLATPVLDEPIEAGWVVSVAERAEAVATATAIVRRHQRRPAMPV